MKKLSKILLTLFLISAFATAMTGCQKKEEGAVTAVSNNEESTVREAKDAFKIAALIPGSINDGSWGTTGYNAAKQAAEMNGAEFSYTETKSDSDILDSMIDYGERGYSVIVAHGNQYQDAAKKIAPDYPNTYFVTSSGNTFTDTITAMYFKNEGPAYLAGALASRLTKTGKVGCIGSIELPSIKKIFLAFEDGVQSTDPDVECIITFLGTQTDVGKARESVLAMINNGVDIIYINANRASQGCYEAGNENTDKVKMFGSFARMDLVYPDLIIASGLTHYEVGMAKVIKDVKNGVFESGSYSFGMQEGAVENVFNETMDIPEAIMEEYDSIKEAIIRGDIRPKMDEEALTQS